LLFICIEISLYTVYLKNYAICYQAPQFIFFSPGFKIYHRDIQKFINFRLHPETPAGTSSMDPLETSVL